MPPTADDALTTALGHHRAGNLPMAEKLYRQVLTQSPDSADAWHSLGVLCLQSDRAAEAVELIGRAVALRTTNPDFFSHLGAAYGKLGQHEAAITNLRHAVRLAPQSASAHYNLGTALRNVDRLEEAAASFRHAIATDPKSASARYNLANTLRELQRYDEAEASYREALRISPGYQKVMINLGNLLTGRRRYNEAIDMLRAAVAADPKYSNAHVHLGSALRDARRFDESVESLRTAVALNPKSAEAQNNLGTALQAQGKFDESWSCTQTALKLKPDLADAHFSRGVHLLRQGDLANGFAEYEWRWKCKSFSTWKFDRPRWDGSPLDGRTILLQSEQGLGDTLHFVRYAADVKRAGGTVIVECPPRLMAILADVEGIDRLLAAGSPCPPYDERCPLMSLPGVLGLSIDQLSRGAYLKAQPERVERWREKLVDIPGFRIGICWQGNPENLFDRQRSFLLRQFAPVARIAGVRLISFQMGYGSDQVSTAGFDVAELGSDLDADGAFLDTAAVMKNLDLVISTDTAPAHLAGALGVPVWIPMSVSSDWRWFTEREDSPWYPSMRLFRQRQLYEWDEVFERIAAEVATLVSRRS